MPRDRDTREAAAPGSTLCRIVLVDDHPIVRAGLTVIIDAAPDLEVCGHADNADTALEVVDRTAPDLVLVDLSLRSTSGLELLKQLASRNVAAVVVSMHDDPTWAERALAAGARGYVHKSGATREVVEAIRRARSGRLWVSERISERLLAVRATHRDFETGTVAVDRLSDRELEVFSGIGRGLTTQQIAAQLLVSPKTVQTHRQRIKEKLGLSTAAELSSAATRWVVSDSPPERSRSEA